MSNDIISDFWKKATTAKKCEEAGLWGLITPNGEVVLKPEYDQIEVCADFIYAFFGLKEIPELEKFDNDIAPAGTSRR